MARKSLDIEQRPGDLTSSSFGDGRQSGVTSMRAHSSEPPNVKEIKGLPELLLLEGMFGIRELIRSGSMWMRLRIAGAEQTVCCGWDESKRRHVVSARPSCCKMQVQQAW